MVKATTDTVKGCCYFILLTRVASVTFLVKIDMAVSGQDVEYCVEKAIDEQNETDEERSQQHTGSTAPLRQTISIAMYNICQHGSINKQ